MTEFSEELQKALGSNYQLDRELSGGGMSRVFLATDLGLGRKVVVKVLPPELAAGVNRERFRREIQVAAQLHHPHIVPLLSAGEEGDLLWYTMPYIEGESLRTALESGRLFRWREVLRILHDIVDALAFAHERGVIHRDIKPANILTQGSHALVTDFGVAKAISAALPISGLTSAGIAIGTPAYMAPEQLAGDPAADHRVDIYAVGLLAYELVVGASPFAAPSPRETLTAQLTRDPKPLHEISTEIPRSLSTLIMRCLAKDPNARPQSAQEVLREIDSMTMPLGVAAAGMNGHTPSARRARIAGLLFVLLVIFAIGYLDRVRRHEQRRAALRAPAPTAAKVVPSAGAKSPVTHQDSVRMIEDSVRIFEAGRREFQANATRDSAERAKLAKDAENRLRDSLIAAHSVGAVPAPRRRVAVIEWRDRGLWPDAPQLSRAVADSLRSMLNARPLLYTVVQMDSARQRFQLDSLRQRAQRNGREGRGGRGGGLRLAVGDDLVVAIRLLASGDSARLEIQSFDPTAAPPNDHRVTSSPLVPQKEVFANLVGVLLSTLDNLALMSRAPRAQLRPDQN